ncbi:hypothetical protein [Roseibium sp.]|uniref:VpaChn25_0724 family phage protein n=2 Tax=Roseibium sp. TaxID=1936156 RepID=UPI003265BD32
MSSEQYKAYVDERGRMVILQVLTAEVNGHLREELLQKALDIYLIKRSIEWVRTQLIRLEELGAVTITEDEGKMIAGITRAGRDHMERRSRLAGVAAPDDKV